ncbi:guanine nucleotide binding protein, alpha subunit [Mycena galopus ATCC 62051]|nr:guanine nucleotide binding protein, alpha subunit [Mycena galopus ATCC 62051]
MGQPVSKKALIDEATTDSSKGVNNIPLLRPGRTRIRFDALACELAEYRTTTYHKNVLESAETLVRMVHREVERALAHVVTLGQPFSQKARLAKARSDAIDQQIMQDALRYRRECKILLLGLCGSGKRTIVQQMKINYGGFDVHELAEYRMAIYENVLDSAGTLARAVRRVGVEVLEEGERAHAVQLLAAFPMAGGVDPMPFTREPTVLTPGLADAIWHLSHALAIECLLEDSTDLKNALYFLASIHRIAAPTYVHSEEDILRTRTRRTAIVETRFSMGALSIHMFDISGQRSERKKWIHCFESVTSIIFCTALSAYDEVDREGMNRMRESLCLFESVVNSRWFLRTSVILLLNKIDEFRRKLSIIPLERYFPEYTGGADINKAAKYVLWRFMQENRARLSVYPHLTQASDTRTIRLVFAAVKETILQNALKDSGIL